MPKFEPKYEIIVIDATARCCIMDHIEARVTCLDTGEARIINWDGNKEHQKTPLTDNPKKLSKFNETLRQEEAACLSVGSVITLYSEIDKTMDEFAADLKQYMNDKNRCCVTEGQDGKCGVRNNCSDAVNYALNYFFPKNNKIEGMWQTFKCVTFPACVGTLGLFSCVTGAPPGINQPKDVIKKAWLLSFKYGKKSAGINSQNIDAPLLQKMV